MQPSQRPSSRAKKPAPLFVLSSLVPVAAAVFATASGCGSGHGTSYVNPPLTGLAPSSVLPSAFPSGVLPSISPSASNSPTPTPTPTLSPTPGGSSAAYTVATLGQPSSGQSVVATDLNTTGQSVGYGTRSGITNFIAYATTNNTFAEIGALSGQNALPHTIDDNGQIVGRTRFPGGTVQNAFVLTNGTLRDLGNLGGSSDAYAINRSGQVVGFSYSADVNGFGHAFLYENGAMRDLGTLGNGNSSRANDINDAGIIVGSASTIPNSGDHPMIYENGQMREIPSINGGSQSGLAYAINNRGQVVGQSSNGSANRPFLYENGVTRDLGTLGGNSGAANDVNEAGQIVGYSTTSDGNNHGFVYQNNTLTDLNSYNPYPNGTSRALSINENGQILLQVQTPPITTTGQTSQTSYLILTPSGRKR